MVTSARHVKGGTVNHFFDIESLRTVSLTDQQFILRYGIEILIEVLQTHEARDVVDCDIVILRILDRGREQTGIVALLNAQIQIEIRIISKVSRPIRWIVSTHTETALRQTIRGQLRITSSLDVTVVEINADQGTSNEEHHALRGKPHSTVVTGIGSQCRHTDICNRLTQERTIRLIPVRVVTTPELRRLVDIATQDIVGTVKCSIAATRARANGDIHTRNARDPTVIKGLVLIFIVRPRGIPQTDAPAPLVMAMGTREVNGAAILIIAVVGRMQLLTAMVVLNHIATNLEDLLHVLQAEEVSDWLTSRIRITDRHTETEPSIRTVQILMGSLQAQDLRLERIQTSLVVTCESIALFIANRFIRTVRMNMSYITFCHCIYKIKLNTISIKRASILRSLLQHQLEKSA